MSSGATAKASEFFDDFRRSTTKASQDKAWKSKEEGEEARYAKQKVESAI